jgi:hypothetical protein
MPARRISIEKAEHQGKIILNANEVILIMRA